LLEERFGAAAGLWPDDKAIADLFLPSPARVCLELMRCDLAAGKLKDALARADKLWDTPQAATCCAFLVAHHVSLSRLQRERGQSADADAALERARAIVVAARKAHATEVCLAWQQALLMLQMSNPNLSEADTLLNSTLSKLDKQAEGLLWARWLAATNRPEQALEILEAQKTSSPQDSILVREEQNSITLRAQRGDAAKRLMDALTAGAPQSQFAFTELLLGGCRWGADESPVSNEAADRLSMSPGLRFLNEGESHQVNGAYRRALAAYERAMQFYHSRSLAREHLVECLMGIAEKESCDAAFLESRRLHALFPDDSWVLFTSADLARRLDRITSEDGVAAAVKRLEEIVRGASVHPVQGAYLAAFLWNDAGRPDIARAELREALKFDATHRAALELAARLSLEYEDWDEAFSYAAFREKVEPATFLSRVMQAKALAGLGKPTEARSICADLIREFPKLPHGYRGMTELLESAKDYRAAYDQAMLWHAVAPDAEDAVRASIRLLVLAGQPDLARQSAKRLFAGGSTAQKLQNSTEDTASESHQVKVVVHLQSKIVQQELPLMGAIARGFNDGGDLVAAAEWAQRLLTAADKAPPKMGAPAVLDAHLLLGETYRSEAQRSERRKELVGQALEHLQKAYQLSPGNPQAGVPLALLLCQERNELDAACRIIDEMRLGRTSRTLVGSERLDLGLLNAIAIVYHAANKHEDAAKVLVEARKRYEREPSITLHLGRAYAALKKTEEARTCFGQAILQAEDHAAKAFDSNRKTAFQHLADEAREEQRKLGEGRPNPKQILKT
jgi:tetratricopeptide (TPR) repeat protein